MEKSNDDFKYMNKYAYPLNTLKKSEIMAKLLSWAEEMHVYDLGRWGEHRHYNSDATVELALAKADLLMELGDESMLNLIK